MVKINFKRFINKLPFTKTTTGYKIDGLGWRKTTSAHGKSRGIVKCPCCQSENDIFIWSFRGSGKRCKTCNVLMGTFGAYISFDEITDEVLITHNYIILNETRRKT